MYAMNQSHPAIHDPSALVPAQLLSHVHLVSTFRYPIHPSLQPAAALEYLIKGPQIVNDTQPVAWTYFASPPPDGTILLTWQPPRAGTSFASDGLVWADPEMVYDMNIRGYNIQVFVHKCGYVYPTESVAAHQRCRYRIAGGPGHFDPNLWLVHYSASDQQNRIHSNQIPIPREVAQILQHRAHLQAAGPLMRKEFMLKDTANWPRVEFGQNNPMMRANQPQQYNRVPFQGIQQPPNKKPRPNPQPSRAAAILDSGLEEEENSTQDNFDFLTPRDISLSRYQQHHEWMEEIFSSPYGINRILPVDLGLGLMGELAPLTEGLLDTPAGEHPLIAGEEPKKDVEGYSVKSQSRLSPEQLKEFETRVADYTAKEEAELEKMRAVHAKKIAALKRSRTYIKAERRLREAPRHENPDSPVVEDDAPDVLDAVVGELEKSLGIEFESQKNVSCIEKGGFIAAQQIVQKAQQSNGSGQTITDGNANALAMEDAMDVENSAAGLLDQYGSTPLTGTPSGNISVPQVSQPQSQSQSAVATPNIPIGDSTHAAIPTTDNSNDLLDLDVEMSGMTNTDGKGGEGDWVLVDQPQGAGQPPSNNQQASTSVGASGSIQLPPSSTDAEASAGMFDTPDFVNFDNLDTAGDALADYTNVDDTMGLDLVDDSAFGDAFHGTEMHGGDTEGDTA
ncbi:DUF1750-domain-containing protein [Amniculicola lignicola CBS 123094]|uniref:DUF1750-domain-containing protein n=1 Tax=Amniculicola lignicola CBS 123094 TaxID=1392246 RepID=A0A6A5WKJ6_9PLEO|nr:DUF1750-domain-containing protein [Amniculicola lignicola CBS 123094]